MVSAISVGIDFPRCPLRGDRGVYVAKAGKTAGCMVWLTERAMAGRPGHNFWWVAPIRDQAKIVYRRLKRSLPIELYTSNEQDLTLTLLNGCVIWFKGADHPDSLYGEDVYAAVIDEASRCFLAGTLVDTPNGRVPIEQLQIGDAVYNAVGVGQVTSRNVRNACAVAVVTVQGCDIVSSPDHEYFTDRGWVQAQDLTTDDAIVSRAAAVRLVQGDVSASTGEAESAVLQPPVPLRGEEGADRGPLLRVVSDAVHRAGLSATSAALLRAELLREVENDAAVSAGACAGAADAREGAAGAIGVLGAGHAADKSRARADYRAEPDALCREPREGVIHVASYGASTPVDGRQGTRNDDAADVALRGVGRGLGVRVPGTGASASAGHAELLLSRSGARGDEARGRGRRLVASAYGHAGRRPTQDGIPDFARVDGVAVLESDDPRFTVYSAGQDTVDLYDLSVSGHPSFSVNGLLVHNCKDDAWHAVRTTLTATNGPIRIIGNVKGRRNWAYNLARKAEAGAPGMRYAKITAHDAVKAGIISAAEVEDARAMLPDAVFRELYLAEPSDDAGNPFGLSAIRARIAPLSQKPPKAFGLDLAKSGDWCVLIGLDEDGTVCRFDRWQGPWEMTIQRVLGHVASVPVLVDSTGAGDPVLEALQRQGRNQSAQFIGFTFSASSKQKLMEGLAVAIQQKQVAYPDGPIVNELETFEFEYRRTGVSYSAPEGLHDDCVCGLALAVQQRTSGPRPAYTIPVIGA